jgi:hypothetical protein
MRSSHLAFMTCGLLRAPLDDASNRTFVERSPAAWADAEASDGFIGYLPEPDPDGRPNRFLELEYANRCAITLTRWRDLESVYGFVFHSSSHAAALRDRSQWFLKGDWPTSVAWWFDADTVPTQLEALARYDLLATSGSTPAAFDLRHPFGSNGTTVRIDRSSYRQPTNREPSAEQLNQHRIPETGADVQRQNGR